MALTRSFRRMRAVILKEYKHIWLDPGFFFLTVLSPAVLLMLLSYIFSFDVDHARLAVIDNDNSPQSQAYVRSLTADGDLTIDEEAGDYDDIARLFQSGRAEGALVIPPGFGSRLAGERQAPVNLVVDGSDAGTAYQVISSVEQRTLAFAAPLLNPAAAGFDVRLRVWFNENLRSQYSMVPGLIAIVLIMPAMSIALAVAREKESGAFESLVTTPVLGSEYLAGKLAVFLSLGLLGGLMALGVAVFWFRVPFRGSFLLYALLMADYLFALMGFCLFIANFVGSQRAVSSIVLLALFIPSFFLTGLLLPVDKSSFVSEALAFSIPSTHFIIISRGVALKGILMRDLWWEALILFVTGLGTLLAAITLFKKKLA